MQKNTNQKSFRFFPIIFIVFVLGALFFVYSFFFNVTINNARVCSDTVELKSNMSGTITKVNVIPGTKIQQGDIIAQVNSSTDEDSLGFKKLRLAQVSNDLKEALVDEHSITQNYMQDKMSLNNSKNNLNSATYDYNRYRNAYRDGAVTRRDVKNAKENLKIAKIMYTDAKNRYNKSSSRYNDMMSKKEKHMAEIELIHKEIKELQADLVNTIIIADTSGTVKEIKVNVSDYVNIGDVVASASSEDVYVNAHVQNKNVKIGDSVTIIVPNSPDVFEGTVSEINNKVAKISFNNNIDKYHIEPNSVVKLKIKIR